MTASLDQAQKAKDAVAGAVGERPEVNGVGIARLSEGYGVRVNVREDGADDLEVPSKIDGVPVRVGPVGKL